MRRLLALFAVCGVVVAGCGTTTKVITSTTGAPSSSPDKSANNTPPRKFTIGDTATLAGQQEGERLEATAVGYKPSISVGEFDRPDNGMRFVGVTLKLRNVGTRAYSDSPSNGATILTTTGKQGKTALISSGECSEGFSSSVKIAPGDSQQGCIPFELPIRERAAKFQWTPGSGFAESTAEWSLPGAGSETSPGSET